MLIALIAIVERVRSGSRGCQARRSNHHRDLLAGEPLDIADAVDKVADELLRIDEQMSLVDYEMGAGLFKSGEGNALGAPKSIDIPQGTDEVYFKFDGEYWSDELADFSVLATDRCVR